MNRPGLNRFADHAARHVAAWVFAAPLSILLLETTAPGSSKISTILLTGAFLVVMSLLFWNRWCVLGTLSALSISLFLFRTPIQEALGPVAEFFNWAGLHITGWQPMNADYADAYRLAVCAAMAVGAWLTALRFRLPVLAFLVFVTIAGHAYYYETPNLLTYTIPLLAGLFLLSAQTSVRDRVHSRISDHAIPRSVLALTALPLIFAIAWMPVQTLPKDTSKYRSPALIRLVDDFADAFQIRLGNNPTRESFSIGVFGFYPNRGRLGGTVRPSGQSVLAVTALRPALLRGTIMDTYAGDRWSVSFPNEQHRLDGIFPIQRQAKESAFDLLLPDTRNWPDRTLEGVFFDAQTYDFRMLTNTGSILFTPGRVLSVDPGKGMDLIPYFNNLGEIFVQRSLRVKDNYKIEARVLRTEDPAFPDILTQARLSSGSTQEKAYRAACLALPDSLPASVRILAEKITVSTEDPYAKALAIRAFLRSTCVYSLVVPNVPEGRDFVAWFLQTKAGYCTYFASALTVLSRCAGIPARYVEGFAMSAASARAVENGMSEYTVTGKEAHAWSEVYIDGAGWIPMDATPGFDSADLTPTPEPSAAPSPEPVTETPETPTPLPTPTPPDSGSSDNGATLRLVLYLVLFVALFSAGGIYLYRRVHWYDADRMKRRLGSRAKVVETYWRASTHMLRRIGLFSEPSYTTYDYVTRWTSGSDGLQEPAIVDSLRWLANLHVAVVYGNHEPSGEEISRAQHIHRLLARRYRLRRGRLRYYFVDLPFDRML